MNLQSTLKPIALRPGLLKPVTLVCGLAGLGLYGLLYATGMDGRGLLKSGHPAWIALCVLSALTGILVFAGTAALKGSARFPRSLPACIACAAAALCAGATGLADLRDGSLIYAVPGILAALSLAALAVCRIQGARPNFLLHVVVCIHFALQLLKLYQINSTDPQTQDYFFQMLACIALTITAYQLAVHDLGQGQRRWLWLASLCALYLCLVSLGSSDTGYYLTGAAWAFTAVPAPRRRKTRQTAEGENA